MLGALVHGHGARLVQACPKSFSGANSLSPCSCSVRQVPSLYSHTGEDTAPCPGRQGWDEVQAAVVGAVVGAVLWAAGQACRAGAAPRPGGLSRVAGLEPQLEGGRPRCWASPGLEGLAVLSNGSWEEVW